MGFNKQTTRPKIFFYNLDAPRVALQKRDMLRTTASTLQFPYSQCRHKGPGNLHLLSVPRRILKTDSLTRSAVGRTRRFPFGSRQASTSECASNHSHLLIITLRTSLTIRVITDSVFESPAPLLQAWVTFFLLFHPLRISLTIRTITPPINYIALNNSSITEPSSTTRIGRPARE